MILFSTDHQKLFNNLIHHFLEIEIFDGDTDIGEMVEMLYPRYLYREQFRKCVKVLEELYQWTGDVFYHQLSAFHELALYYFVEYMTGLQKDMPEFCDIYFDEKNRQLIKEASEEDLKLLEWSGEEENMEECERFYYEIENYEDCLFEDLDFLLLERLYNAHKFGDCSLEEKLGINIDYYFELLPLDIQEQYKTGHITLTEEVSSLLQYLEERIHHGNLYKLFWENGKPVKEERIQLILENIMDAYFFKEEIEITREALVGNGKVDFKLYKNSHEDEKVLVEIKRASSSYLKKGYEKQLTNYMLSSKYKNAFYLIACFTDEEYERSIRFIREHVYIDTIQLYINIFILDFRKRKPASVS